MKRKFFYLLCCFVFLLACSALIMHCGGGGGGGGSSPTGPATSTTPTFTTAELVAAAGTSSTFKLEKEVEFFVSEAYSNDGGTTYTMVLKFRFSPSSSQNARGLSAYVFSFQPISASYYHQDKWQTLWAGNSPAGDQIRKEKSLQLQNDQMIGSYLNRSYQDLGEITIKTPAQNQHSFVLYPVTPEMLGISG